MKKYHTNWHVWIIVLLTHKCFHINRRQIKNTFIIKWSFFTWKNRNKLTTRAYISQLINEFNRILFVDIDKFDIQIIYSKLYGISYENNRVVT